MLDEDHDTPEYDTAYGAYNLKCGSMIDRSVVLAACPPGSIGNASAGRSLVLISMSYRHSRITMLVGIGGGMPRFPPPNSLINSTVVLSLEDIVSLSFDTELGPNAIENSPIVTSIKARAKNDNSNRVEIGSEKTV